MNKGVPLSEAGMTILEALEEGRIVSFGKQDGQVLMAESCDGYFKRTLTKDQFGRFITALQDLYEEVYGAPE